MGIEFGDSVVSSRHGHTGRVYGFEHLTDEDQGWIDMQSIPLTPEDIQGRFVRILCNGGGGAVSVPERSCHIIDPIEDFQHMYAEEYFGNT